MIEDGWSYSALIRDSERGPDSLVFAGGSSACRPDGLNMIKYVKGLTGWACSTLHSQCAGWHTLFWATSLKLCMSMHVSSLPYGEWGSHPLLVQLFLREKNQNAWGLANVSHALAFFLFNFSLNILTRYHTASHQFNWNVYLQFQYVCTLFHF